MDTDGLQQRIFSISHPREFNAAAQDILRFQYAGNSVYRRFVDGLKINPNVIANPDQIPFLPVSFFKSHRVLAADYPEQLIFESSGTTGMIPSRHYVADTKLYEESFTRCLELFYGDISGYNVFALLPSYLERQHSSLIYMVERLMWKSDRTFGGFYLKEMDQLRDSIMEAYNSGKKIMLFGVTFALLDMAEKFPMQIPGSIVIETGGMKGRRKELVRMELHEHLKKGFGVESIHSEYGMTELLSQAWSKKEGIFQCPPWMKIVITDPNDPFTIIENGRTGAINIIDLANIYSCSFISTQDLGRKYDDDSFEVLGRFDNSDIRGCSLLVS
ncbi:MAG: acyl transferase [Bacteroidetes bacterium]|nr:acyl transferase [Bacteroidota bacterium]